MPIRHRNTRGTTLLVATMVLVAAPIWTSVFGASSIVLVMSGAIVLLLVFWYLSDLQVPMPRMLASNTMTAQSWGGTGDPFDFDYSPPAIPNRELRAHGTAHNRRR